MWRFADEEGVVLKDVINKDMAGSDNQYFYPNPSPSENIILLLLLFGTAVHKTHAVRDQIFDFVVLQLCDNIQG